MGRMRRALDLLFNYEEMLVEQGLREGKPNDVVDSDIRSLASVEGFALIGLQSIISLYYHSPAFLLTVIPSYILNLRRRLNKAESYRQRLRNDYSWH